MNLNLLKADRENNDEFCKIQINDVLIVVADCYKATKNKIRILLMHMRKQFYCKVNSNVTLF